MTVQGITGAAAIAAGGAHTCAVLAGGTLKCWGLNADGQIGIGDVQDAWLAGCTAPYGGVQQSCSSPKSVSLPGAVAAIDAGQFHTCAVLVDTTVHCWGEGRAGQLGSRWPWNRVNWNIPKPVQAGCWTTAEVACTEEQFSAVLTGVTAVAAGSMHTCALKSTGGIVCWGDGHDGQLGNGTSFDAFLWPLAEYNAGVPVTVSGITNATGVSAAGTSRNPNLADVPGSGVSCARLAGGTVSCWGTGDRGQLGNGSVSNSSVAVPVQGLTGATAVSASAGHVCALRSDTGISCWGSRANGELGDDSPPPGSSVPVEVAGIDDASAISAGGSNACALISGTVRCWGQGWEGRLGNDAWLDAPAPVTVSGIATATEISVGSTHSCALLNAGTVSCWGSGEDGQLGNGAWKNSDIPVTVSGIADATTVTAGRDHSCAIVAGGTVRCWGGGLHGQLGNGVSADSDVPVSVTGITDAVALRAGESHTCARLGDASLRCWGEGILSLNGDQNASWGDHSLVPVPVFGSAGTAAFDAGLWSELTACGVINGGVRCWTPDEVSGRHAMFEVGGVSGASALGLGPEHGCGVVDAGAVRCWGRDLGGSLGDGRNLVFSGGSALSGGGTVRDPAVTVAGLAGAVTVAAGDYHSCALLAGGTIRCWGWGQDGQLGDGRTSFTPVPVPVVRGEQPPFAPHLQILLSGPGDGVVKWGPTTSTASELTWCGRELDTAMGDSCEQRSWGALTYELYAQPMPDSYLAGWSGACNGTGPCAVKLDADKTATAHFERKPILTIGLTGSGTGSVVEAEDAVPGNIQCPTWTQPATTCPVPVTPGTTVVLEARPMAGSAFVGWSGACNGMGTCTVKVNADTQVNAEFAAQSTPKPSGSPVPGALAPLPARPQPSQPQHTRRLRIVRVAARRGGVVDATITFPAAGSVRLTLSTTSRRGSRRTTLARFAASVQAGTRRFRLVPSKAARRLLRRERSLRAQLRVELRPIRRATQTASTGVLLLRR